MYPTGMHYCIETPWIDPPDRDPLCVVKSRQYVSYWNASLYYCNGFEITFVLEKHVVEDDVLFTNHLAGKYKIPVEVMEYCHSTWGGCGSSWL